MSSSASSQPSLSSSSSSFVPEEYLDQHGVTAYLKDAITLLLENRPKDPVRFLADYFSNAVRGTSSIGRAYRYIRLARHSCESFMDNVAAAYRALDGRKVSASPVTQPDGSISLPVNPYVDTNGVASGMGVRSTDMLRLLRSLCADFPSSIIDRILDVFRASETTLIPFPLFASSVRTCLLYEDFLDECSSIFSLCSADRKGNVRVDRILSLLSEAIRKTNGQDDRFPPLEVIENALRLASTSQNLVSFEDFSVHLFLLLVREYEECVGLLTVSEGDPPMNETPCLAKPDPRKSSSGQLYAS